MSEKQTFHFDIFCRTLKTIDSQLFYVCKRQANELFFYLRGNCSFALSTAQPILRRKTNLEAFSLYLYKNVN